MYQPPSKGQTVNTFTTDPGVKTYRAANGHMYEVHPHYSQHSQTYFYIYATGSHSDTCDCATWDVDDWGDML